MLKTIVLTLTVLCISNGCYAKLWEWGSCPSTPKISNFAPSNFAGLWYEIQRLPVMYEAGLKCSTSNFTFTGSNQLNNVNMAISTITKGVESMNATGTIPDPTNEPNRFVLNLSIEYWLMKWNVAAKYDIWATDATSTSPGTYALVYSCKGRWLWRDQMMWILSRSKTLPDATIAQLKSILSSAGIDYSDVVSVVQDC